MGAASDILPVVTSRSSTPAPLRSPAGRVSEFLEIVAPKLGLVEEVLRENFRSKIRTIEDVGEHILQGGGKRLRPALVLLVADMLGYKGSRDVIFAAVVEFIHTATLVHDDIIDEAALRRGRTSINFAWGNHLSVLAGDYLYMHAMKMALKEGNLEILDVLSDATIRMIEGEILGLETNGRTDLSIDTYFEIAHRKTAALFGASCRIPAILTNASEQETEALRSFGENLGVCFQLVDDLLDFTSTTAILGKPALADLKEGKVTLPLLLALPNATDAERRLVEKIVTQKKLDHHEGDTIVAIVKTHGTIEQTREIVREYADRARAALSKFPETRSREALEAALDYAVARNH
jgi:octaprenyl-diphosphate synthase